MDAAEDSDLLLQRTSDDLLYELAASVPGFLFKELDKCGGAQLRRSVSHTATHHVIKLVFQHLSTPLPFLLMSVPT